MVPAKSISVWIRNERATLPEAKRPSQSGKVISWQSLSLEVALAGRKAVIRYGYLRCNAGRYAHIKPH